MIRKTVEFATPGTRLSVAHRQLVVERPDHPRATRPIEDLGVVVVDDIRATYTQAVFVELLDAGATIMVTGRNHLPIGMMLPLDAHHVQTERHRAQVEASEPVKKRAWQALVRTKIAQQGEVLTHFTGNHGGLSPMSKRVRSGDPDNLEAQAAQRYWPLLFGKDFRRDREADGINALLNYGVDAHTSAQRSKSRDGRNPQHSGVGAIPCGEAIQFQLSSVVVFAVTLETVRIAKSDCWNCNFTQPHERLSARKSSAIAMVIDCVLYSQTAMRAI